MGGISVVIRTETVCPDIACQGIVQKDLDEQKAKREALSRESELREKHRHFRGRKAAAATAAAASTTS